MSRRWWPSCGILARTVSFGRSTVPLTVLRFLTVARILEELQRPEEWNSWSAYGGPGPAPRFSEHEWAVDLWVSRSETAVVTAAEIPALTIATLADHPPFGLTPFCVMADRRARRLVVVPCWEVFRFYYARAASLARLVFQFPVWRPETLDRLLCCFDGHLFRPAPSRSTWHRRVRVEHAANLLKAIGRDAVVAYARTGRAQIRAVPPFRGATRLTGVGIPVRLGEFEALFVQQILGSEPQHGEPGVIRWQKRWVPRG